MAQQPRAVVVGAGIAGMAVAQALSPHFAEVVVLEKRPLDPDLGHRQSPKLNHVHVLFKRGAVNLERLFPGIETDLLRAGARAVDLLKQLDLFAFGRRFAFDPAGSLTITCQSRALLETTMRRRLGASTNVTFRYGQRLKDLQLDAASNRVTGVFVEDAASDERQKLSTDLVVLANGHVDWATRLLARHGLAAPRISTTATPIAYATRVFRSDRPEDENRVISVQPHRPHQRTGGHCFPIEGGAHQVSLIGLSDAPMPGAEDMLEWASQLPHASLRDFMARSVPEGPLFRMTLPNAYLARFDEVPNLPDGLVVVGESLCRLDPIFGHGMTVCVEQAILLAERLRARKAAGGRAAQRVMVHAARLPWALSYVEGIKYRPRAGYSIGDRAMLAAFAGITSMLGADSPRVDSDFLRMDHFVVQPTIFLRPHLLGAALQAVARHRAFSRPVRTSSA
jgi:2-polyprenyl-6-methoxyphenol hydroxylase-like FAD-dependent oxidoreductase